MKFSNNAPIWILGVRLSAIIEMAAFFILLFVIALLFGYDFNFFAISPHPFWIAVILISTQYGTVEGLLAALVSTLILFFGPIPQRALFQEPYDYLFMLVKLPLLWFVTAVILGELRMRQLREMERLKTVVAESEKKEETIAASYEALKRIKERLELHISCENQTTLGILNAAKHLEERGKEGIINGAMQLTKALIAPEKFSLFLIEKNKLQFVTSDGWDNKDHYAKTFDANHPIFNEIVERKRMLSFYNANMDALGKEGISAVPIIPTHGNKVMGMIKIEQIPFMRLRTATLESLHTIGEWVGNALESQKGIK